MNPGPDPTTHSMDDHANTTSSSCTDSSVALPDGHALCVMNHVMGGMNLPWAVIIVLQCTIGVVWALLAQCTITSLLLVQVGLVQNARYQTTLWTYLTLSLSTVLIVSPYLILQRSSIHLSTATLVHRSLHHPQLHIRGLWNPRSVATITIRWDYLLSTSKVLMPRKRPSGIL